MTPDMIDLIGFAPRPHVRARSHHAATIAQVITLLALVLSIAVAATAVTIGIARADALAAMPDDPLNHLAAPILLALAVGGMGGLAMLRWQRGRTARSAGPAPAGGNARAAHLSLRS